MIKEIYHSRFCRRKGSAMTLKQIDCAVEVAYTLNYHRAAENLFISQPSLTYQIQTLEEEVGFAIFRRSARGTSLTPAGAQFCKDLSRIRTELKEAIERARNFTSHYTDTLNVYMPMRSAIYYLPAIMRQFQAEYPHVALSVKCTSRTDRLNSLLRGNGDVIFEDEHVLSRIAEVKMHPLYQSHIYLVATKKDPLATQETVTLDDLKNRTVITCSTSVQELVRAQKLVVDSGVEVFNCQDYVTAITNIAAGNGVCLLPGFSNDHNGEFVWIPVSFGEPMNCVLGTHVDDQRPEVMRFVELAQTHYKRCAAKCARL